MKHLFITFCLALITFTTYAQIQRPYSTVFSDSISIKNNFGNDIYFFDDFNLIDLENNNGYALMHMYDDMSYAPKYLMMKFDVNGNLTSDTIYDFIGVSSMPYPQPVFSSTMMNNNFIGLSSTQDSMSNEMPFIFAIDANGNVAWNTYFGFDSISAYSSGMFADKNNNEILTFGEANDYNSNPAKNESFITKLDANGNILWTKKYAMEGSDTNQLNIRTGAMANDGDYLFAGNIYGNMDMSLRYFKTDVNGNIIWDIPFTLTNLPGNDTISPGEYKGISKLYPMKDGSATIVGEINISSTETNILFLLNFDQSTGAVNYTRRYYLPSISIYPKQIIMDKNENIIISMDDFNGSSYLTRIDKNGIITASHQLFNTPTNTGYSLGLAPTDDKGILLLKEKTGGQMSEGYFLFKTNQQMLTSCADTAAIMPFFIENIAVLPVTIGDTVYNTSVSNGVLSISGNTSGIFQADNYCDCQISISGTVADINSTPAANTPLYLYKVKPLGQFELFDSTMTDAVGNYMFDYLPEEQFIIKSSTNLPNTVSTYYGSPNDHVNWDSAWVFNLSCTNQTLTGKDITLIPTVPQTGNGVLSGFVYDLGSFGTLRKSNPNDKALGDPIPDIDITVNQSPGGTVGISTTDNNGGYNFAGLNVGASFIVTADIPGLPNDSTYTINITVTNNNFDSLNFYIDSAGVYILDTNLTTSVTVYNDLETAIELMPNPTQNNVNLVIQSETSSSAAIRLTSYTGSIVSEKRQQINKGKNTIELVTDQLSSGIYFIQIQMNNKIIVKKLVKQ